MSTFIPDQRDQKLLTLLRDNARYPVAELARQLNLSRTAVRHRIARLEKHQLIQGYTLKSPPAEATGAVQAMTTVILSSGNVKDLKQAIGFLPGVLKIWSLADNIDAFVLIQADTIEALYKTINQIGECSCVERVNSHIVLDQLLS